MLLQIRIQLCVTVHVGNKLVEYLIVLWSIELLQKLLTTPPPTCLCLFVWLVGGLVGWLVGWFVGWLVGLDGLVGLVWFLFPFCLKKIKLGIPRLQISCTFSMKKSRIPMSLLPLQQHLL